MQIIGIIGGSNASPEQEQMAREIGAEVAKARALLLCGGRGGVMEAACRGAKEAGGMTLGILPGTQRDEANEWVDIPVVTGLGEARNAVITRTADALIAVGGRYGTLSEIAFGLHFGTPVVGVHTWEVRPPESLPVPIHRATTAQEAVRQALRLAEERS
jgi:uncharacterized protein (TIGR00725 family)